MYNHVQFLTISLVANVSTKRLCRVGMDRSDKEMVNKVQDTSVLRCKAISSYFWLPPPLEMLNQNEISKLSFIKYCNKKLPLENDIKIVPSNLLLWLLLKFTKTKIYKYINFPQIYVH